MQELNEYVAQKNKYDRKGAHLDLNNAEDRAEIASSIHADLSPENLYGDGEVGKSWAKAQYQRLSTVAKQLQTIGK
jgi:hypothetical protein